MPRFAVPVFAVTAALSWGFAVAAVWLPVGSRLFEDGRSAAITLTILAAFCARRHDVRREVGEAVEQAVSDPLVRRLGDAVIAGQRRASSRGAKALRVVRR